MNVKSRRRYTSPQRDAQANATRLAILDAAESLFASRGFVSVTMDAIAQRAGVSLATVYVYFPGKPALVTGLAEQIVAAGDLSVEQVEREPDPVRQLQTGARIIRRLNERSWLVADILRTSHQTDAALAAAWATWQQRHLGAITRAMEVIHARGALRDGLTLDEAIDTFYALASSDVYRSLVRERGWSPARYERWLLRMARTELLGIAPGHERAARA
jgi:AcrR family transcriptional regulator